MIIFCHMTTVQTTSVGREQSNLIYNIAHYDIDCHDLAKQLSYYLYLLFFFFLDLLQRKECGKVVHRPCSSCISSV